MKLEIINPLEYAGWDELLYRSENFSFFHSFPWAEVLNKSYGYKPLFFASFESDKLCLLMPFMSISSWLTGKRGVSLPFTDHCKPFFKNTELLSEAVDLVKDYGKKNGWQYIEWRDEVCFNQKTISWEVYYTHYIDLLKTEQELLMSFKESNRRNINKAIREGLSIKTSCCLDSLNSFYDLHCLTRKRHGLPPQPFHFFKNIFDLVVSRGYGTIFLAKYLDETIAAYIFFNYGKNVIFKYGASNINYQLLRPNNLILWEAIKYYRVRGFESINLGRTEFNNYGLLQFKRQWGGKESLLRYYRFDLKKDKFIKHGLNIEDKLRKYLKISPTSLLVFLGRIFYKHIG